LLQCGGERRVMGCLLGDPPGSHADGNVVHPAGAVKDI